MTAKHNQDNPFLDWNGTWDAEHRRKLASWLATTPDEKMAWLEEARKLAAS